MLPLREKKSFPKCFCCSKKKKKKRLGIIAKLYHCFQNLKKRDPPLHLPFSGQTIWRIWCLTQTMTHTGAVPPVVDCELSFHVLVQVPNGYSNQSVNTLLLCVRAACFSSARRRPFPKCSLTPPNVGKLAICTSARMFFFGGVRQKI
eukprot:TRINITY_DN385_c1_g5_i1.p1 TRINITY_DN385_c1_g5~~TRINITY_DN385_c1_g5_i1.p1  ORF type:complete len:147 (+),score=2.04 TRINITY_DN385_c1_g5_i1:596-1036(+)